MVITAPSIDQPGHGPRPINLNKDIPQVLELLRLAFGEALDTESRQILQGQTAVSGQPPILYRFNPLASRLSHGYVWEKDGRIVGNVTLLTTRINGRYLIVNVAVHPGYRRQGIARMLMHAVTDHVAHLHGREILLQVDHDNENAINLYEDLGYQTLGAMNTWLGPASHLRPLEYTSHPAMRALRGNESRAAYELDVLALPPNLNWPEPIPKDTYQTGLWRRAANFVNGRHQETWITTDGVRLTGSASLWSEWGRAHQLALRIHPHWQGELERPLLAKILSKLPYIPRHNVRIEHPQSDELTNSLLKEANFKYKRTLTHMRLDLTTSPR